MAEEFERFKRFEYRQNSNLVLQRDTSTGGAPALHLTEPTGEPESLAGRKLYPMGDKVERGLKKEEKQAGKASAAQRKSKLRRNKLVRIRVVCGVRPVRIALPLMPCRVICGLVAHRLHSLLRKCPALYSKQLALTRLCASCSRLSFLQGEGRSECLGFLKKNARTCLEGVGRRLSGSRALSSVGTRGAREKTRPNSHLVWLALLCLRISHAFKVSLLPSLFLSCESSSCLGQTRRKKGRS